MIDYPAALAVATVVRTGSFEKAARVLRLTPSAVSQRVKAIEDRIGVALIVRGSPCVATEQGEWLCRHVEQVGVLEGDLLRHLPGLLEEDVPGGARPTVSIVATSDSLGTWFVEAAAAFARETNMLLNIVLDDEGFTADWLEKGRVVAAVTSLPKPVRGCRVTRLGALRYVATASPGFMDRHFPQGVTAGALSRAPSLTFNQKDRLQQDWMRATFPDVASCPTHWLPSTQGFIDACLLGMGWCMNPMQLAARYLEAGRLVELVPGARLDVALYWQVNRFAADRLAVLTHVVSRTAARHLAGGDSAVAHGSALD